MDESQVEAARNFLHSYTNHFLLPPFHSPPTLSPSLFLSILPFSLVSPECSLPSLSVCDHDCVQEAFLSKKAVIGLLAVKTLSVVN